MDQQEYCSSATILDPPELNGRRTFSRGGTRRLTAAETAEKELHTTMHREHRKPLWQLILPQVHQKFLWSTLQLLTRRLNGLGFLCSCPFQALGHWFEVLLSAIFEALTLARFEVLK